MTVTSTDRLWNSSNPLSDGVRCCTCKKVKPHEEFAKNSRRKNGKRVNCKLCHTADRILAKYGITLCEYWLMYEDNSGLCDICEHPLDFLTLGASRTNVSNLDHCHSTGMVRGVLCGKCNKALGQFNDDENLLYAAIDYLRRNRECEQH